MSIAIKNQVVLIIGASSGIGRETARLLARQGARVMASARREDRLRTLQSELTDCYVEIYPADATRPADMERLVQHTREQSGDIDVLVYVTGANTPDRSLKRLNPEIWDAMIAVNLNGAYYATRAVLPAMRERGAGHLIYIASTSALGPDISGAAYQASKRGLLGLAHAVRFEEKGNGIRTCVICPGLVDTELLEKRPVKPTPEQLARALKPVDLAEAVLAVAQMPPRVTVLEMHVVPSLL
jgi:NADP-dependent 3-hydroxy acid dehydrogenase YdfG